MKDKLIRIASFSPDSLVSPHAWCGHLPFAAWLTGTFKPSVFVELGTHSGNSYFSFCQSVKQNNLPTKCYAIDTWEGDEHAKYYSEKIYEYVFAHNQERYASFSTLMRMKFDDALSSFDNNSIKLLHIDGLHTYEAVKHDFLSWYPKLALGAVVLFHDTSVRDKGFGVWRFWQELQEEYSNNFEFTHSNGLGVIQLDGGPEEQRLDWLRVESSIRDQLREYFAVLGSYQVEKLTVKILKQDIEYMLNSRSWLLTKPLRFIDEYFFNKK